MRIVAVTPWFPSRSEPFTEKRLTALAQRGHEIRVVAAAGDGPVDGEAAFALKSRFAVLRVPDARPGWRRLILALAAMKAALRDPRFVFRLWRRLRDSPEDDLWERLALLLPFAGQDADVVHFEWANVATRYLAVLDLLPGAKVVSAQGADLTVLPQTSAWVSARLPKMLAAVDRVHCVSAGLAKRVEALGTPPERIACIPNGVDTTYFSTNAYTRRRPADPHDVRLVSVARLHWMKGLDYALLAARELRTRGHDVRYTIVGSDNGYGYALRYTIHELGLDEVVDLVGSVGRAGVRAHLANADIFVLSSLVEGLSLATLEAMAMELPVVATDVGGTRELLVEGEHGLLVPSRDPTALADAVERLIVDPGARQAMGRAAGRRVREDFDGSRSLDLLVDLYASLQT